MASLKETTLKYYCDMNMNCAEATVHGANEYYGLGLTEDAMLMMGAFGGGLCNGRLCGACAGLGAALSKMFLDGPAHADEAARKHFKEFSEAFIETFGSDLCCEVRPKYWDDTVSAHKCHRTVALACDILEEKMAKFKAEEGME